MPVIQFNLPLVPLYLISLITNPVGQALFPCRTTQKLELGVVERFALNQMTG